MQYLNFILSHKIPRAQKKNKPRVFAFHKLYFQRQDFKLRIYSQKTSFELTLEKHTLSRG